ncbi:hypothetical protein [Halobacterium sp. CBA1126]|uniref:hypothetical protein n=1 Tax=Halobacterium TaxID=2239 RepID=UPI0012FC6D4F|nr:hypothetical protein [Halobacterium sp. CBA1126]MUV61600.1 hypothetical protein [Halobacterium sp. CBA1126]
MPVTYRVVLRSTETQPSRQTQESVLPAMSQKFGRRVSIEAADIAPDDRLRATVIGTVDTDSPPALRDVYEYVKPHRLVRVKEILTDDAGGVVVRKAHEVDRERVERHERATVLADVRGDLLVHVAGDESAASE